MNIVKELSGLGDALMKNGETSSQGAPEPKQIPPDSYDTPKEILNAT